MCCTNRREKPLRASILELTSADGVPFAYPRQRGPSPTQCSSCAALGAAVVGAPAGDSHITEHEEQLHAQHDGGYL
jgi:hypothetical protein